MAEKNIKKVSPQEKVMNTWDELLGNKARTLLIGETKYNTLFTKKFENRKVYKPADPKMILSYIPGTILKILVKEGTQLKSGEPIMILEAMKMRNIVTIPVSGKLKKIFVKEGETIPKNFIIAEVE